VPDDDLESLLSSRFYAACDMGLRFPADIEDLDRWLLLSERYDSWIARSDRPATPIPRVIHQIWIGGVLPEKYGAFARSWKALNPGFEYRLWDEASILAVLDGRIAEIFDKTVNFGAKSDIARYAILERFGGMYADTDFECLKPLDTLLGRTSFFAGITVDSSPQLMNSIMGAAPGHPFLRVLLAALAGPVRSDRGKAVLASTGPYFLSSKFFEASSATGAFDVVFPTRIFYPFPSNRRREGSGGPEEIKRKFHHDEALAIHYWEVSWQKEEGAAVAAAKGLVKRLVRWEKLGPFLRRRLRRRL